MVKIIDVLLTLSVSVKYISINSFICVALNERIHILIYIYISQKYHNN
jgi:hypothetical protein